ncbi:nucleoside deaminase [Actinomyces sp. zg-332]|uniref:nucleoside deaminase n=1 Tax=Actinomyces sp. zg-332 TaxID=2708340 RepID=UPI00142165FF|nr:nucleoside deaminase [Actinomyces sp. zg-332]QPK94058.1 nucleoside deaminase [Actinomyces sp. zg-332]
MRPPHYHLSMDKILGRKKFHEEMIERCIHLGKVAQSKGDIPVGCVIVHGGQIVALSYNTRVADSNPLGHAELNAISAACEKLGVHRLDGATLYVNLEPCTMCAAAIQQTHIKQVFFGAWDEKNGGCGGKYDLVRDTSIGSYVEVYPNILEEKCVKQLEEFFQDLR